MPQRLVGIALMLLTLVCFTGIDTSAKWLGRSLPPLEVSFFRYLVAFLAAAVLFDPWRMPQAWRSRRPVLQILRGLCLLGSTVFNFIALRHLQLAETMTIAFSAPFLIALMSGAFLGERIDPARWGAIVVGFGGVLLVTRPTSEHFDPMMLVAFLNIVCYAIYAIITRLLAGIDSSQSMLLIPAGVAVVALAPTLFGVWVTPQGASVWALVILMGLFGAAGHFLLILAFSRAPASVVAPFTYTQIVWMTLSGWVFFGDVPGGTTIAGGAVVICSGLWLLWQERRRNHALPQG